MLKKHSEFFKSLLFLFDLSMIAAAWLGAYGLRFGAGQCQCIMTSPRCRHTSSSACSSCLSGGYFQGMQLYRPRRVSSHLREVGDILKASTLATLVLMVIAYFLKEPEFSRVVFVYFWSLSSVGLICSRLIFRELLRVVRRRGYNLRHSHCGYRACRASAAPTNWAASGAGIAYRRLSHGTSMKLISASTV